MSYVKKEISLHLLEQMEKDAHNILERICVLPDEEKALLYLKEIVEKGVGNQFLKKYQVLHKAIRQNKVLLCQFVLQQGVDVNYLSNEGKSGLCCAIENRHWETFNFLIDNHADIHWLDKDGYNLFLIALDYKQLDMAKILMQKGVNVFHQTQHGKNALCCLGTLCDLTFTQKLIDKGLDYTHVNVNGLNLLHHSASCNQIEAFKFYCEKGLNPYLTENKGYNAFYYFNGARLNNPNYELAIEWYKTLLEKEKLNQALKESEIKSSQKIKI